MSRLLHQFDRSLLRKRHGQESAGWCFLLYTHCFTPFSLQHLLFSLYFTLLYTIIVVYGKQCRLNREKWIASQSRRASTWSKSFAETAWPRTRRFILFSSHWFPCTPFLDTVITLFTANNVKWTEWNKPQADPGVHRLSAEMAWPRTSRFSWRITSHSLLHRLHLTLYTVHSTVKSDRCIKSYLASRNQLRSLVCCKFGRVTLKKSSEALEVYRVACIIEETWDWSTAT